MFFAVEDALIVSMGETIVIFLAVACAIYIVTQRIGMPYTIGLVLAGLLAGLIGESGSVHLSAGLVFYGFLPTLLFEAAVGLEARYLVKDWWRIAVLAVPGVLVAFGLTALGVHFVGGMAWGIAVLFSALIAATDPVSVVALFRTLGVPARLTSLINAESLFNDGTAAVLFAVALAGVTAGGVSIGSAAVDFVWMFGGGFALGVGVGYLASLVHHLVDDHLVEITISTIAAYGSFFLGHALGVSPVVACVMAGVVIGNYGRHAAMTPAVRDALEAFWEYAAFAANSLIFLLIGTSIYESGAWSDVSLVAIAFVVTVAARAVIIYSAGLASRLEREPLPWAWQHVLTWGGLRGTVALALVLSVPADLAGRETLQTVTFGVVLLSLVGQGLTVPPLVRYLKLGAGAEEDVRTTS